MGNYQMNANGSYPFRSTALAIMLLVGSALTFVGTGRVYAASAPYTPHFATLKSDEVHVRKGPGRKYDILWTYRSLGLPLEVTAKHEHWRRVRDSTGAEGWVYFRLLSALRMGLISPWTKQKTTISLFQKANTASTTVVRLEPGVKVLIKSCSGAWCFVSVGGFKGWIEQTKLWGVYPGEIFE